MVIQREGIQPLYVINKKPRSRKDSTLVQGNTASQTGATSGFEPWPPDFLSVAAPTVFPHSVTIKDIQGSLYHMPWVLKLLFLLSSFPSLNTCSFFLTFEGEEVWWLVAFEFHNVTATYNKYFFITYFQNVSGPWKTKGFSILSGAALTSLLRYWWEEMGELSWTGCCNLLSTLSPWSC